MKLRLPALVILLSVLLTQCAKQTAPTGGPKDETPPKLKSSFPKDKQVNFQGDRIELVFDEPIQLNNPREQIIITPSVGKDFLTTYNKARVTIELKRRLQDSTTYTFNFREAIQDLTEKNPANAKIAFSTGTYLDSLQITGRIADELTQANPKNYTVALAEASDTFNIYKHPASWITQTDKSGKFLLENLKPGRYILYAFDDKSKNLIVDSKTETYGFVSTPITLQTNSDSINIRTFKADVNPLKLITSRPTFAYFNLRFSKSLFDYSVTATDSVTRIHSTLEPDLTTVKLYNTIPGVDSLQIRVQATDSLNYSIDTLVYLKFSQKQATRDKFLVTAEGANANESNSVLTSTVTFSKPVQTFNNDSVFILVDSLTRVTFAPADFTWNKNRTKLKISTKADLTKIFPPDTTKEQGTTSNNTTRPLTQGQAAIVIRPATFISVEQDSSAALTTPVTLIKLESTAIIEAEVVTSEYFVLQLITKSGKLVREIANQKKFAFENLPPDTYQLRLVIDKNNNGKWDPGNFLTKAEPEPIVYYKNPKKLKDISLKANWTLGPLLITY